MFVSAAYARSTTPERRGGRSGERPASAEAERDEADADREPARRLRDERAPIHTKRARPWRSANVKTSARKRGPEERDRERRERERAR